MKVAIVIPAYNEELTVRDTILQFHHHLPESDIYVVDNNSDDDTGRIARATLQEIGFGGNLLFECRQGKAYALRKAFAEIDADIYIMTDADLTYSPHDLPGLLAPVLAGEADMAVGDRQLEGDYARENKRAFHLFGNRFVRGMINAMFESGLKDIMSGYRVMNRMFVKNFPILSKGFEIETEMTLHALHHRFRIVEIPIGYRDRPSGSFSKLNTVSDGIRVVKTIFRIFKDFRPFAFFSALALFFSVAGFLIGLPVILEFLRFRYVYKVPSAILASGCMIVALILFSIGLILDTIVRQRRFDYELRLLGRRD